MTTTDLETRTAAVMERVIIGGDLSQLQPAERIFYYRAVCESLGVNPLTKPFEYLALNGKLVLYAKKDCTDQLRARDAVSITELLPQQIGDLYVVTAKATNGKGRTDTSTGAVNAKGLGGEALANAMMKAETKAKRRVTLSLCGLGILDESEVDSIPGAQVIPVDPLTGEMPEAPALPAASGAATQPEPIISENQGKRFHAIARGSGWSEDQCHDLLAGYQITSSKLIPRRLYDEIIDKVKQAPK